MLKNKENLEDFGMQLAEHLEKCMTGGYLA